MDLQTKKQALPGAQILRFKGIEELPIDPINLTLQKVKLETTSELASLVLQRENVLKEVNGTGSVPPLNAADNWNNLKDSVIRAKEIIRELKEEIQRQIEQQEMILAGPPAPTVQEKDKAEKTIKQLNPIKERLEATQTRLEQVNTIQLGVIDNTNIGTVTAGDFEKLIDLAYDAQQDLRMANEMTKGISNSVVSQLAVQNMQNEINTGLESFKKFNSARRNMQAYNATNMIVDSIHKSSLSKIKDARSKALDEGTALQRIQEALDVEALGKVSDRAKIGVLASVLQTNGDPVGAIPREVIKDDLGVELFLDNVARGQIRAETLAKNAQEILEFSKAISTPLIEGALSRKIETLSEEQRIELITKTDLTPTDVKRLISDNAYNDLVGIHGNFTISARLKQQAGLKIIGEKVEEVTTKPIGNPPNPHIRLKESPTELLAEYKDALANLLSRTSQELTDEQVKSFGVPNTQRDIENFKNAAQAFKQNRSEESVAKRQEIARKLLHVQARLGSESELVNLVPVHKNTSMKTLSEVLGVEQSDPVLNSLIDTDTKRADLNKELVRNMLIRGVKNEWPIPSGADRDELKAALERIRDNIDYTIIGGELRAGGMPFCELKALGFSCVDETQASKIRKVLETITPQAHGLDAVAVVKLAIIKSLEKGETTLKDIKAGTLIADSTSTTITADAKLILNKPLRDSSDRLADGETYIVTEALQSAASLALAKDDISKAMIDGRESARDNDARMSNSAKLDDLITLASLDYVSKGENADLRSHLDRQFGPTVYDDKRLIKEADDNDDVRSRQVDALSREGTSTELISWAAHNAVLLAIAESNSEQDRLVVQEIKEALAADKLDEVKTGIAKLSAFDGKISLLDHVDLTKNSEFVDLLKQEVIKDQLFVKINTLELSDTPISVTDVSALKLLVAVTFNGGSHEPIWPAAGPDRDRLKTFFGIKPPGDLPKLTESELKQLQRKAAFNLIDIYLDVKKDPANMTPIASAEPGSGHADLLENRLAANSRVDALSAEFTRAFAGSGIDWQEKVAHRYANKVINHAFEQDLKPPANTSPKWESLAKLAMVTQFDVHTTGLKQILVDAPFNTGAYNFTGYLLTRVSTNLDADLSNKDEYAKGFSKQVNEAAQAACVENIKNEKAKFTVDNLNGFFEHFGKDSSDPEFYGACTTLGVGDQHLVSCLGDKDGEARSAIHEAVMRRGLELNVYNKIDDLYKGGLTTAQQTEQETLEGFLLSYDTSKTLKENLEVEQTLQNPPNKKGSDVLFGDGHFLGAVSGNDTIAKEVVHTLFAKSMLHKIQTLSISSSTGSSQIDEQKLKDLVELDLSKNADVKDYLITHLGDFKGAIEKHFDNADFNELKLALEAQRTRLLDSPQAKQKIKETIIAQITGLDFNESTPQAELTSICGRQFDDTQAVADYLIDRFPGYAALLDKIPANERGELTQALKAKQTLAMKFNIAENKIADETLRTAIEGNSDQAVSESARYLENNPLLTFDELQTQCALILGSGKSEQELQSQAFKDSVKRAATAQLARNYVSLSSTDGRTVINNDYNTLFQSLNGNDTQINSHSSKLTPYYDSGNRRLEANKLSMILFGDYSRAGLIFNYFTSQPNINSVLQLGKKEQNLDDFCTTIGIPSEDHARVSRFFNHAYAKAVLEDKFTTNKPKNIEIAAKHIMSNLDSDFGVNFSNIKQIVDLGDAATHREDRNVHLSEFLHLLSPVNISRNNTWWKGSEGEKALTNAHLIKDEVNENLRLYETVLARLNDDLKLLASTKITGTDSGSTKSETLRAEKVEQLIVKTQEVEESIRRLKEMQSKLQGGIEAVEHERGEQPYAVFHDQGLAGYREQAMVETKLSEWLGEEHVDSNPFGVGNTDQLREAKVHALQQRSVGTGGSQHTERECKTLTKPVTVKEKDDTININVAIQRSEKGIVTSHVVTPSSPGAQGPSPTSEECYQKLPRNEQKAHAMSMARMILEQKSTVSASERRIRPVSGADPSSKRYWDVHDALVALAPSYGLTKDNIDFGRRPMMMFQTTSWPDPTSKKSLSSQTREELGVTKPKKQGFMYRKTVLPPTVEQTAIEKLKQDKGKVAEMKKQLRGGEDNKVDEKQIEVSPIQRPRR
jgi:hypothetical protein